MSHPDLIILWPWREAPDEYKKLSPHGGDEDWVLHVPERFVEGMYEDSDDGEHFYSEPSFTSYTLNAICERIGISDTHYELMDDGSIIAIGAHA